MLTQEEILSWSKIFEIAKANTNAKWMRRPGQSPATTAISNSLNKITSEQEEIPVLLYKDTNSWCPYCERVVFALEEKEIPYQVEFIDLKSKPQWYLDIVPTGLVPAAKIKGELIYESKDILLALEDKFSSSLLPSDSTLRQAAIEAIANCESKSLVQTGYRFIWGSTNSNQSDTSSEELASLKTEFEAKLEDIEEFLAKYPGDYFMGEFSLVDIMYAPHLNRIASNLPVYRGYQIRGNERFPNLNRWYEAIDSHPAYDRIKSDSTTDSLVLRRIAGLKPAVNKPATEENLSVNSYEMEAAAKLSDNHEAIIGDIFRNSGIEVIISENDRGFANSAIDLHLRLLAEYLITANKKPLVGGRVGGKGGTDAKVAAIGAIALAYLRNRVSAPRDLSAGAAIAFRAAIDTVMRSLY